MAITRRDHMIGGKQYSILLPGVRKSMGLVSKTTVLLGPILGGLKKQPGVQIDGLKKFGEMLSQLDPDKLDALLMDAAGAAKLCCNEVPIATNEIVFEQHFSESRGDIYLVLFWTLWECVRDFFPMLEGISLASLKEKAEKAFQFQQDGTKLGGLEDQSGQDFADGPSI